MNQSNIDEQLNIFEIKPAISEIAENQFNLTKQEWIHISRNVYQDLSESFHRRRYTSKEAQIIVNQILTNTFPSEVGPMKKLILSIGKIDKI